MDSLKDQYPQEIMDAIWNSVDDLYDDSTITFDIVIKNIKDISNENRIEDGEREFSGVEITSIDTVE
ncbi:MAG: hypothetical protein WC444_05820 [Candidatus Paceibacterota bacterium]